MMQLQMTRTLLILPKKCVKINCISSYLEMTSEKYKALLPTFEHEKDAESKIDVAVDEDKEW